MIVTYDEWGGFYDHVVPPVGPVAGVEATFNDGTLGFRTPCVILGPRAKRGHVSHLRFDPNSVINLIRWRFGLPGLSVRDDWSLNMARALELKKAPNFDAPEFSTRCRAGAPGRTITGERSTPSRSHRARKSRPKASSPTAVK